MQSGRIFFPVNSNTPVNLADKETKRIFGSTEGFRNNINATYKRVNWHKENGNCTLIAGEGVLDFSMDNESVIEKFVVVEVTLTDEPLAELSKFCNKYNWLLFDPDK